MNHKLNCKIKFHLKQASAAIVSLLIVATVVLTLALSASLISIDGLKLATNDQFRAQALTYAQACLEEAAHQLKLDPNYAGGTLNVTPITCSISIVTSGQTRTATITGTAGDYTKTITAIFTITASGSANNLTLDSWQEI